MTERAPALLLLALLVASCGGAASAPRSLAELTNPSLGPEHTAWLVGPIARIATAEEIQQYLALRDDAQAAAFVQAFWQRRDPSLEKPGNPFRETYERRAANADRLYSEAGFLGRRTDRGVLYVLYGPPAKADFEISPVPHGPPIEVWVYGSGSPSGLDGRRPAGIYRFVKTDDLTVLYVPGVRSGPVIPPIVPDQP